MSTEGGGNPRNDPDDGDGGDSSPSPDDYYAATATAAAAAAATPTRPVAPRSSFYAAALAASSNLSEYAPFLPSDSSGASLGVGGGTDYSSNNGDRDYNASSSSGGGGGSLPPVPASPVGRRAAGSGVKVGEGGIGDVKLSPGSIVNEDRVKMVNLGGGEGEEGKSLPVASFYPGEGDLTPRQVSEDPDVLMDALAAANRRRAEEQAGGAGVVATAAAAAHTTTGDLIGDDSPHPASPGGVAAANGEDEDGGPELDENLLMQYQIEAQCQAAVLCERNTGYNPMTARNGDDASDVGEGDAGDGNNDDDNDPSSASASNGSRRRSSLPERPLVAPPPEVKLPELFGDLFRLELVRPTMPVPTKPTGAPVPPRPDGPELVVGTWIVSLREAREILQDGDGDAGDDDGDDDAERKEDDEGDDGRERWSVDRLPWVVGSGGDDGDEGTRTTGRPKDDDGGGDGERKEETEDAGDERRLRDERFVLGSDERAARCLGCDGLLRVPGSASLATCPKCRTVSPAHWARTLEESSSSGVR